MKRFHPGCQPPAPADSHRGFTLVELLVSMTVLSLLLLMVSQVLAQTQRAWTQTSSKVSQFREARRAFDIMKRNLSQATLNTYLRYRYNNASDPLAPPAPPTGQLVSREAPAGYVRWSELQFVCGPAATLLPKGAGLSCHAVFFQAPLGASSKFANVPVALNSRGYYIQFGSDKDFRPDFINAHKPSPPERFRYRLMEYAPPVERNTIYDATKRPTATGTATTGTSDWFLDYAEPGVSHPVAENVVALYLSPKRPAGDAVGDPRSIAPNYAYDTASYPVPTGSAVQDSRAHELPPEVELVMAVIDEGSASRLADSNGTQPPFPTFSGFQDATKFREDLDELERTLVEAKVNFRIFSTTVQLRNSRWNG